MKFYSLLLFFVGLFVLTVNGQCVGENGQVISMYCIIKEKIRLNKKKFLMK